MLIIGFIVGCGGKKEADNDKIVLRFSWWGNTVRHETTLAAINRYMELNPNVKIEAEYGGWDGYYQKVSTQLVGGVAPDIMQLDIPWLPEMTKSDVFLNLYDYTDTMDLSGFNENFLKSSGEYNGKLLSLPTGVNGFILLHDKALNEKYDIKGNMNWDDFIEVGKQIQEEEGEEKFLLMADSGSINGGVLRRILVQKTGKNLVSEDYERNFSVEDATETFDVIKRLYSSKVLPPLENTLSYDNNWKEYPQMLNGNIFSAFDLIAGIAATQDFLPEVEWEAVSLPVLDDAKDSGTWIRPAQMISISKNTKHPEEAAKFLNYFYNNEEAIKLLGTARSVPAIERAWDILEEEGILDPATAKAVSVLMENSGVSQNLPEYESTLSALNKEFIHAIALGQLTPEEAAKQFTDLYDKELERLKRRS